MAQDVPLTEGLGITWLAEAELLCGFHELDKLLLAWCQDPNVCDMGVERMNGFGTDRERWGGGLLAIPSNRRVLNGARTQSLAFFGLEVWMKAKIDTNGPTCGPLGRRGIANRKVRALAELPGKIAIGWQARTAIDWRCHALWHES